MKSVIIYYSRSGNTEKIAKRIQEKFSSDTVFVEPEEAYGNYVSSLFRVEVEMIKGKKPIAKTKIKDLSQYDVIFLGFPVWDGEMPVFMKEYIKECNIQEKIVVPFATAGSNGYKSSLECVHKLVQNCRDDLYFYTNILKKRNVEEWLCEVEASLEREHVR